MGGTKQQLIDMFDQAIKAFNSANDPANIAKGFGEFLAEESIVFSKEGVGYEPKQKGLEFLQNECGDHPKFILPRSEIEKLQIPIGEKDEATEVVVKGNAQWKDENNQDGMLDNLQFAFKFIFDANAKRNGEQGIWLFSRLLALELRHN